MSINYEWYDKMFGDVVDNLKKEIEQLTFKVQKAREEENWGTYKNLILAYKAIVGLYQDILLEFTKEDVDKTQNINSNLTLGFDKATSCLFTKAIEGVLNTYHKDITYTGISNNGLVRKTSEDAIKLFCEEDFSSGYIVTKNNNEMVLKARTEKLLSNKLEQGVRFNKLIDVSGFRGIGKTHSLINFAKKYDYVVIVPHEDTYLRDKYNYDEIYNQNSIQLRGIRDKNLYIVDEGVDINFLKDLKINIATGYIKNS